MQRLVRCHGVAEDEYQNGRNDVGPRQFPVPVEFESEHELNVADDPVEPVNPANANRLDDDEHVDDKVAAESADNVHDDQASLCTSRTS